MLKRYGNTEIGARTGAPFQQTLTKPKSLPPQSSHWFWNPNQVGVRFAPEWFLKKLHEIDPDLTITWDNYQEKWLVWAKNDKLQSKLCRGWTLLFPVRYADGSYMPLDERLFSRLYGASATRWGNAKHYFDAIEREWERDRERAERSRNDEVKHSAGEYYDFMTIKNIGKGNKFANHFS